MKIDSASEWIYFTFWSQSQYGLAVANCQLEANGTCTNLQVIATDTNSCTYTGVLETCLDLNEENQTLYFCFCDADQNLDVFSSDLKGQNQVSWDMTDYTEDQ
jgi:hypothetical protein